MPLALRGSGYHACWSRMVWLYQLRKGTRRVPALSLLPLKQVQSAAREFWPSSKKWDLCYFSREMKDRRTCVITPLGVMANIWKPRITLCSSLTTSNGGSWALTDIAWEPLSHGYGRSARQYKSTIYARPWPPHICYVLENRESTCTDTVAMLLYSLKHMSLPIPMKMPPALPQFWGWPLPPLPVSCPPW